MNALIWLLVAALAALGAALTVDLVHVLQGSAQPMVGSGMLLLAFWLGLYGLRRQTAPADGATASRVHDACAFGVYAAIAAGFFFVMQKSGWSPRLDDRSVRDSVTFLLLCGVAWQVVSSYWLRQREGSRESGDVGPPTVRTAMMVQVVGAAAYLGLNADRLPLLPPMMVANVAIQMLLLSAAVGALRSLIAPSSEHRSSVGSPGRDPVLPR